MRDVYRANVPYNKTVVYLQIHRNSKGTSYAAHNKFIWVRNQKKYEPLNHSDSEPVIRYSEIHWLRIKLQWWQK